MRSSLLSLLLIATFASVPALAQETAEYCYDFDQSIPANGEAGCFDNSGFWNCQACHCGFIEIYDYYINIILSALGILSTLLVIIGFIGSKSLRKAPGDIILALSLGDFFWSMIWFKISLDNIQGYVICQDLCLTYSYIYNSSRYVKTAYYLFFCLYYYNTLNYSLKGSRIPDWFYHVGALSLALIVFCYKLFDQNSFGMAINGACGTKTSGTYTSVSEQLLVFTILPIFLLIKTSRSLKTGDMYQKKLQQFLSYYKFYVIGTAILYFFIYIADVVEIYLLPEYYQETMLHDAMDAGQQIAIIAIQMATFLRSGHPIILTQLRMRDPLMRQYWGKIFCCYDTKGDDEEFKTMDSITDKSVEMMQQKLMDASYIKQFQHSLKVQTVYSILSSLQYYWAKFKQGKNVNTSDLNYELECREKITMKITESFLNKEMPELLSEVRKNKYTVCDGMFTIYAPKIFDLTIKLDDLWEVMTNSLDLKKNFARILKAGINGGGKSGEFFFFSSDNKLIIKTITEKEVGIFLRVLPQITRYYENNQNSLIAKTYGLFSFEREGAQEKYNFILMKNINGYPSNCVERKYDLKGSTYTRNTISTDLNIELNRLKFYDTLKDLDFLKYEQKFWVEEDVKTKFIEVLRRDSMFLRELGLIDYSLAVYIINKDMPKTEEGLRSSELSRVSENNLVYNAPEGNQGYQNPYASMKSAKEPYYYNLGIIDFLTIYTCKKRWEKYMKRIQNRNWKLDTSVQNPTKYSERFIKFFEEVTL